MAIAMFAAALVASLDWYRLWALMPLGPTKLATIETAVEPNLLLISSDVRPPRGTRVRVTGQGSADGVVASIRAHKSGARMEVVLEQPWTHVASTAGTHCAVELLEVDTAGPVAFAVEGSSERVIALRPFVALHYGDTVYWSEADRRYLYQVTGLRLDRDSWDGAAVVSDRVAAQQIGAVDINGRLEFAPALPKPYAPVYSAAEISAGVPPGFVRLGVISGTGVEFGISPASLREHHLAILGMSGMGKSTVSRRLCDLLKDESFVVAMDGTSEYRTRFGLPVLD